MKRIIPAAIVLILLALLSSCATKISTIKKNPAQYIDKKVTICGTVTKIHLVPHSPLNLLGVYDRTDTIVVLTDKEVKKNSNVTVSGQIVVIGGRVTKQRAAHIERRIADFLIENDLATRNRAYQMAKKVLVYLWKILPKAKKTLVILESRIV